MKESDRTETYVKSLNDKLNLKSYCSEHPKDNKDGYLITFGCSWTYGLGAGYKSRMTQDEYENICFDESICYNNSWRKLVSDELNLENINFSLPTSSNDTQFKLAEKFFISDDFKKIKDQKIVVLWGITALARKTFWSNVNDSHITIFPNYALSNSKKDEIFQKIYYKTSFNEDVEKDELETKMLFWDCFFEQMNVKNFWFDSFSSNNYSQKIKTLIDYKKKNRDLSYFLCMANSQECDKKSINNFLDKNDQKHTSFGMRDNHKIEFLLHQHLVNPYTLHPIAFAHKQISLFFIHNIRARVPL